MPSAPRNRYEAGVAAETTVPSVPIVPLSIILCLCPGCFQAAIWDYEAGEAGPLCANCTDAGCTTEQASH